MNDSEWPSADNGVSHAPAGETSVTDRPVRTVVRNFTFMLTSHGLTWALSIIIMVLGPRILSVTDVGNLRFAQAFVGFFALVAPLGMTTYIVKTVARDSTIAGQLLYNALAIVAVWTAVLSVAALVGGHLLGYGRQVNSLLIVFCVIMVFTSLDQQTAATFQGLQKMGGLAVWAAIQELVATVLGVFVLVRGWGAIWFAATVMLSLAVQFVANAWRARPLLSQRARLDPRLCRAMIIGGLPYLLNGAMLLIYGTIDIPILEHFAGSETVAWYAIAYQWIGVPSFFAAVVITALLPSLAAHGRTITPEAAAQANKALRLVSVFGAPVAVGLALISSEGLALLYGGHYSHSASVMQILSVHLPVVSIDMVFGTVLIAVDRQRAWLMVGIAAGVFNVLANFVVIPWTVREYGNGAVGSALITVATELLVMVGAILLRPSGVLDRSTASFCSRAALAALAMVPAVLAIDNAWIGFKVGLGMVVFGVAALVLRLGSPSDVRRGVRQVRMATRRT